MPRQDEEENQETIESTELQENSNVMLNDEPVENPSDSSDGANQEKKKTRNGVVSKQIIDLLLKKKILIIVVAVLILIIIIIFLYLGGDFDIRGIDHIDTISYAESCDGVYLTWENQSYIEQKQEEGTYAPVTDPSQVNLEDTERYSYKKYSFDFYFASIVWVDNNSANDVDNETVLKAMAILVRTRVINKLGENCVVLKDNNPENFQELTGNEPKFNEVMSAVNDSENLMIGRDGGLFDSLYDAFTYVRKYKEDDPSYNDAGGYYLKNTNEVGKQIVPAEWVKKYNVPKQKATDYAYLESFSLYGAKYLLEKKDSQYELYRILEEYFGRDIEYYTLVYYNNGGFSGSPSTGLTCSQLDFSGTPLNKEEFVARINAYLSGKNSKTAKLFRENAGKIYDMAQTSGVNPEMLYIIASKEQNWKDTSFTVKCNNFYGMGVTNGKNTGKCFDSFESGVSYMFNYIKNKGSLDSFVKVYSYLGDYLANPGSWGDGGCIYLTLPEIYGKNYSRCNPSYKCASSRGGAGCVKTTEAEKQAYIDWQASKILDLRSDIFGITANDCVDSSVTEASVGEASKVDMDERMNYLFPNGIPKNEAEMKAYLITIQVPVVDKDGNSSTLNLTVHKKLANEIQAIFAEMKQLNFPIHDVGGYNYRNMASGTGSQSHHSYGVAIDINAGENPAVYQSGSANTNSPYYINSAIVDLWKKHGFYWGGDWSSSYRDPMHFSYTNH